MGSSLGPPTASLIPCSCIFPAGRIEAANERPSTERFRASASGKIPDLLRRGKKAFASGAYDVALKINQELVDREPANAEILNISGRTLCKVGRYVEAEQRFRQALSLDPDHAGSELQPWQCASLDGRLGGVGGLLASAL